MQQKVDQQVHLLLVDDEPSITEPLGEYLVGQGYRVSIAHDAARARAMIRDENFSLVLLDIMMPGEDGLSLCRHLAEAAALPVILLTAKAESMDRIIGLEIGADDYVTKPFDPRELVARIKTVLRRIARAGDYHQNEQPIGYSFAGWALDTQAQRLTDDEGVTVPLSTAEYRMLEAFCHNAGHVLDRDRLLDMVQGREAHMFDRAVDNQVSRLRKKLGDNGRDPRFIQTVRGGGYRFAAKVERMM